MVLNPLPQVAKTFVSTILHGLHIGRCFIVMIGLTMIEFPLLLFTLGRETSIPDLPPASSMKEEGAVGGRQFKFDVLQAADLSPETLREYVQRSEPVMIKNVPSQMFDALSKFAPEIPPGTPEDKLLIDQYTLPSLGEMSKWIKHYIGKRVLYLARFSGGYKGGYAHIDSFPSYNFYYCRRGRKKVYIVPRQYNSLLNFGKGYDSVFVRDDDTTGTKLEWLETIPGYWTFEVEAGDVLLFNNSACIHKFMNLTHNPEIFTMRLAHMDSSPLTLWNDCFNWTGAKYFTDIAFSNKTGVRDTASIEGKPY